MYSQVAKAVHDKGCYIFLQLWAMGRAARPEVLHAENPEYLYVSASDIPLKRSPDVIPHPLTEAGTFSPRPRLDSQQMLCGVDVEAG